MRTCLTFILLIISTVPLISGEYEFQNYSTSEGLIYHTVNNLIQDKDGFIWLATPAGLSRYDSYGFKNFGDSQAKNKHLTGTEIYNLVGDGNNRIWLSTDAGIEFFNKTTEEFFLVKNDVLSGQVFKNKISVDENGCVWMHNYTLGFICYDPAKDSVVYQLKDLPKSVDGKALYVKSFIYQNRLLWITGDVGTAYFDFDQNSLHIFDTTNVWHCNMMRPVGPDTLIVANMFEGIHIINTKKRTGSWIRKSALDRALGFNTTLFDAVVEADGTVIIAVTPGFVTVKNEKITHYHNNTRKSHFTGDAVRCFYRDRSGNIWVGTADHGLFLAKKENEVFPLTGRLFAGDVDKSYVAKFCVFDDGSLLYADMKYVYACDDYEKLEPHCAKRLRAGREPILRGLDGRHSFVSNLDSIFIYDSETQKFTFSHKILAPVHAYLDAEGTIWATNWIGSVYGYNPQTKKKYVINLNVEKDGTVPVYTITGTKDGSLWCGTLGLGLVRIKNPYEDVPRVQYYNKKQEGEFYLGSNSVKCLYVDDSQNLWVGTLSGGLVKKDLKTGQTAVYTKSNGLKSNTIESIVADDDGNVWFTSSVLSKLDVRNGMLTHYSEEQGIRGTFLPKAFHKSASGDLLLASTEGLYVFNPRKTAVQQSPPAACFTNFKINGANVCVNDSIGTYWVYDNNVTYSKELTIPYSLSSFAIEFAAIDFRNSENIMYQYKLDGIDEEWVLADARSRFAGYTKLPYGSYVLNVRSSLDANSWSGPASITINIVPPWWQTRLFRVLLILFVVSAIVSVVFLRFRQIRRTNRLLERKVDERTANLIYSNELMKQDHLVIEMKNSQLNEALKSKDKLIRVLAHDFRNPLQGIIGLSQLLKSGGRHASKDVGKYAELICESALTLTDQMTSVLDWAQSQEADFEAKPVELNVEVLIDDALSLLRGNLAQKRINVDFRNTCVANVLVDPRMASLVFRNLLSNAIKFSVAGGNVSIMASEDNDSISVAFIDDGMGMSREKLDLLLSGEGKVDSERGTDNESGTGLGIRSCQTFLRKNNGSLSIESVEGRGTTVSVSLPKGKKPALKQTKKQIEQLPVAPEQLSSSEDKHTVLVVDDDKQVLKLVCDVLGSSFEVTTAEEGQEGLNVARQINPDIIISDITMPALSGILLCRMLKNDEQTAHIPILMISSHSEPSVQDEAFKCGANDFIAKPFDPFLLMRKVESLLRLHQKIRARVRKDMADKVFPDMPVDFSSDLVKKVSEYIDENITSHDLNINAITEALGVSRSKLWRVVKEETGKSPADFIKEKRMQKAAAMLLTGKYRVTDVAFELGYDNARYFTRWFSKEFGMPPTEYVKKMKRS